MSRTVFHAAALFPAAALAAASLAAPLAAQSALASRGLGYPIEPLDARGYREVVAQACARTGVPEDAEGVTHLVDTLHPRHGQPYLPCIPFDVVSKIADLARYRQHPPRLTPDALDWAWHNYFGLPALEAPHDRPLSGE